MDVVLVINYILAVMNCHWSTTWACTRGTKG